MNEIEEFKKFLEEIKYYRGRVNGISIEIERRDPNFVYLIHNTSLNQEKIMDVYANGIAYSGNDISRTLNNLSQCWGVKSNLWKDKVDMTSMEQVVVESCNTAFQCFIYKIPLVFFEPIDGEFYPIPIWKYDPSYTPTFNVSSSRVKYDINQKNIQYFRLCPTLLLGHYDLRSNSFSKNPLYSYHINNSSGIYDRRQIFNFGESQYSDFWKHNDYIMEGQLSPFQEEIVQIENRFNNQFVESRHK